MTLVVIFCFNAEPDRSRHWLHLLISELIVFWHGLFLLPVWGYLALALGLTHITIVGVTLYLHRDQAHRGLLLHPLVRHFFRFWLWLTTGMVTREWVAVHRKHHAACETCDDPHSPAISGIRTVLWAGAGLYKLESRQEDTVRRYGGGTPNDWLEHRVYTGNRNAGIVLLLLIHLVLFGLPGVAIWAAQMMWIPLFAAGVINGIGHWFGYRTFATSDLSTNISNIGVLIGGEEMHNNHHAYPSSARFSMRWWEFDIGWMYIRLLRLLRLAKVLQQAPRLRLRRDKTQIDLDTAQALVASRIAVMGNYARDVLLPTLRTEMRRASGSYRQNLKRLRKMLPTLEHRLTPRDHGQLRQALSRHPQLREVLNYQRRLQKIIRARNEGYRIMRTRLTQWCEEAEQTGIASLQRFAREMCHYSLQPL